MSLRELLWEKIYSSGEELLTVPESLTPSEVLFSILIAILLFASFWWIARRGFFFIAEGAGASRRASIAFGTLIAFAWLLGALEWAGWQSTQWMIILLLCSSVGSLIYLICIRSTQRTCESPMNS